ncbi:MAG TPA: hypothetical protein VGD98_05890 [Ktedonobacteraceae bacterium]
MSTHKQSEAIASAGNKNNMNDAGQKWTRASPWIPVEEKPDEHWYARISPLWLCLALALAIRIWLTIRTHGTMDGDEALLGIQAEHILQGERPIYFYGIPYFGSLEAYIAAGLFALFGSSVAVLRVEAAAFGLLLVGATWWLADLLAQAARLPRYARQWFATIAALGAALPPLYDGIIEMRTGGGWIESFVIMLLLLIVVYRLTQRWHEDASWRELSWRWALVGLVVGFGMWIYPLISVAILAAALWIICDRFIEITKYIKTGTALFAACARSLQKLLPGVWALPACVLGFTPGIIWGLQNNWENIHYIFGLGGGWNLKRLETIARVSTRYVGCVAPRVIGGGTPLEGQLLTIIHTPLLALGVVCLLVAVGMLLASFQWPTSFMARARALMALPALFGACSVLLYCISSASTSILVSCNADFGGHYAAPLVLALPFFFATAFTLSGMFLVERRQRLTPAIRQAPAGSPGQARRSAGALVTLGVLLLAYLGGQATTYGLTNPDLAFQSAYCTIAPADYQPIIAYMEQENIRYAWATNLLGYQISFETNNRIIVADPLTRIHPAIAINRIPAYTDAVANAERASFLVFVKPNQMHPRLLQLLDAQHITYKTAFFPSQTGIDVMVVTPINQSVSPFVSPDFDFFYCSTQ